MNSIGLALSGGGVKGLAHIGLLKLLDKHKIKPAYIAGTSMGAIIGALYAAGLNGQDIENRVCEHITRRGDKLKAIFKKRSKLLRWAKFFAVEKARGGFVAADGLFVHLFCELQDCDFNDLKIPFCAVAVDYHAGKERALSEGSVLNAVRASMAVPGVFAPVKYQDRLLVDGGLLNNLPTNHIQHCDVKIACDVIALSSVPEPHTTEVISGALNIMITHATAQALKKNPVDLICKPATEGIEVFDFIKIEEALRRGDQAAKEFEAQLLNKLGG